ncbi:N-acetylneuraminate synthase NeuB1 [Butyrivibrio proteoclasticus B316]|uniref:N-acetylneuraminate synthase NeuB1 n=1 Tax=Butyrivibrio proteoclasticus (strain ATCC 51982 / DSM 14932 / B316) TaxID=515622 RepID=E0RZH9_BUTPB|nr:N-acetylneuraminate synthase [Butyrivibrio proteoclasticus]ADL33176.1 N-acetylneuraminate synthase NeuB1 [Butyrivibrio proteoclasticus B316]
MNDTIIIAEAGVNHNGNIEIAKKLIVKAKECGADIVKFQTAKLDSLVSKTAKMAEYQKENIGKEESQKEMLSKLLLSFETFEELADYCKEVGIQFLSTPFDIESIQFLDSMQNIWKVPSGEITNYPYLVEIARTGKDIILSTGMSTLQEVEDALNVLRQNGASEIILLHCTTNYPTPMQDVNLRAMLTLKEKFGCKIGYSDHTQGIEVPIAAVALGATVIEKHFTLDKNMEGPDHKASIEPDEFAQMVKSIRNIEKALGNGEKTPSQSEIANIAVARKSIIALKEIKAGEVFSEENITTKRPGTGINPMRWNEILGQKAKRDFAEDELIEV